MRVLLACATPPEKIAEALRVSVKTLRRDAKYRELVPSAKIEMKALAVNGVLQAMRKGEAWAICFWLKTQFPEEFSEKQKIEIDQKLQAKYLSYEPLPIDDWLKEFGGGSSLVTTTRSTDSTH